LDSSLVVDITGWAKAGGDALLKAPLAEMEATEIAAARAVNKIPFLMVSSFLSIDIALENNLA
jgi:hypothetical protein